MEDGFDIYNRSTFPLVCAPPPYSRHNASKIDCSGSGGSLGCATRRQSAPKVIYSAVGTHSATGRTTGVWSSKVSRCPGGSLAVRPACPACFKGSDFKSDPSILYSFFVGVGQMLGPARPAAGNDSLHHNERERQNQQESGGSFLLRLRRVPQ